MEIISARRNSGVSNSIANTQAVLIRTSVLCKMLGISRDKLRAIRANDDSFPAAIRLPTGRGRGRAIDQFFVSEINLWLAQIAATE